MSEFQLKLTLGLLLGLTTAGAAVYSMTVRPGAGNGEMKPKRVRLASPQDGILFSVGTEVKKGAPGRTFKVRVSDEMRTYRRLRVGDRVKKGQMLGHFDDRRAHYEVDLKGVRFDFAEADYKAAAEKAREAEARFTRLEDIQRKLRDPLLFKEDHDAAVLSRDQLREEEVSKKKLAIMAALELSQAQLVLEGCVIRSPADGVLRAIRKHPGEAVRKLETVFEIEITERD
jgi:multidrug efflux pump subunit AcrA (membrane-fusion protein)